MNIESLDHMGRGITRINGKITFVNKALPNEIVEIKVTKSKNKYNEAEIIRIKKSSVNRIDVKCPYYNECGGCQLLHYDYKKQLEFKQNKIKNIVKKNLCDNVKINDIVFDRNDKYRNKLTLHVNKKIGLYKYKSNDIVYVENCLLCNDEINERINYLNKLNLNNINEFVIRAFNKDNILIISAKSDIDITSIYDYFNNIVIYVNNKYYIKKGNDFIVQYLNSIKYKIKKDAFFQVNPYVTIKLYEKIKEICKDIKAKNVLDLYCGTGSIGIYISDVVNKVYGVEINENAIIAARENATINNISNISFSCIDASKFIIDKEYDTVIVDPPRSGLSKNVKKQLLVNKYNNIIYVSCDPMTLIRDLKELSEVYSIKEITPFDMFPNTYHCETICVLERR